MDYVTTYTYDANNNRDSVTDPKGAKTLYAYDVKNLLTTTTDALTKTITNAYDALDRKISITDKRGSKTTCVYDEIGNLLTLTDALSNSKTYSYDPNGNKLTETNPLGQTVTYTYDALNRVLTTTDPLGHTTANAYDPLGRVVSTTNAKGQTTSFDYDAMGRLTKVTDANGKTVLYTYDGNGNRLSMTDPNGNTTQYFYDDLNRLIQKVEPLGSTYQYAYDAVGNRKTLTNPNGNTLGYAYDANNRLITITYPDVSTTTFTYDENGNQTQMVDKLGTSTYGYDALNRMTSYTDPFGKTVGYGYDASGNRTTLTYPDTKVVNYTYDALNRLIRVTDWVQNSTFYYYDGAGNLTGTLNSNSTRVAYTYDNGGRLVNLSNTKSNSAVIFGYAYTLDKIGNHLQVEVTEPLVLILKNKNVPYAYDKENRLTSGGGITFTYDSNGNMTVKGTDTFTYDYEDRLIQSYIGGINSQYGYDGVGNRLLKTEGGVTKRYILDLNGRLSKVLAETDSSGTLTVYYVYGLGLISKVLPNGTTYNYHYDSRGSTIALTDYSQTITDAYAYDSFGIIANTSGSTPNPFKYVGRYGVMEEGNGLKYIRARYYAPEIGRFISKDLLMGNGRDGQSLNKYVYALNNPILLIDPEGLFAWQTFKHGIKDVGMSFWYGFGKVSYYAVTLRFGEVLEAGNISSQYAGAAGENIARAFQNESPISANEIQGSIDATLGRSTIESLKDYVDPVLATAACFAGLTQACAAKLAPALERLLDALKHDYHGEEEAMMKDTILSIIYLLPWPEELKGLTFKILTTEAAELGFNIYDMFKTSNIPITPEHIETQNYNVRKFKK
jgi:RHS repeat-associated protein